MTNSNAGMQISDWINLAIAVCTALAAIAAWFSSISSSRSSKEANKAAEESRRIAENQLAAQKTTERAWIIISPSNWLPSFSPSLRPSAGSSFQVEVKNVGRTPAHSIKVSTRYVRLNQLSDLPKEPDYSPTELLEVTNLAPADEIGVAKQLRPSPLETKDIEALYNGKSFVYFHACVSYTDAFGGTHETKSGFVYPFIQPGLVDYRGTGFRRWGPPAYEQST
jgi:hypothetical protein